MAMADSNRRATLYAGRLKHGGTCSGRILLLSLVRDKPTASDRATLTGSAVPAVSEIGLSGSHSESGSLSGSESKNADSECDTDPDPDSEAFSQPPRFGRFAEQAKSTASSRE